MINKLLSNDSISVVTVTYNAGKVLEGTIKSVIAQDYDCIEYIIVDGNSNDNTAKIIDEYKGCIDKIICEPDNGIYDAMNKAISLATGRWIHFLNAGDAYASRSSISNMMSNQKRAGGANVLYCSKFDEFTNKFSLFYLIRFMVNHQSIIYDRDLLVKNRFDVSYKIAGDYEQLLRMWRGVNAYPALQSGFVVYDRTGISSMKKNISIIWRERARAAISSDLPIAWKIVAYTYATTAFLYRKIIIFRQI